MNSNPTTSVPREPSEVPDDPRLMQAVQEYLTQLEAGKAPNRAEILRRYPDLARAITQCLDGLELVHKAAKPRKTEGTPTSPFADAAEVAPTSPLGDFQIVREIGRGGMGVVYEAIQMSLGRRVALKVLPFAATFDEKHLRRFHNEAQAAAQLHHTNIVPVYAVGCERGVHFYAMQLIEGQSLAAVIAELRSQGSDTGQDLAGMVEPSAETVPQLSLALSTLRSRHDAEFYRGVARLMVQAAQALEHAHQFGIVHRDVKPANLMVDAHGRLWVTDFGLAQFHTDVSLTQTGDILGTLRYMSPEQAAGQRVLVDHRADIYSLGATLYELATLEPIFAGQNRQELLHQIMHDEPRAPRQVDRNVPIELETILLKSVSKNPADRYSSARALAADLQRYLDDQPILAKRPSLVERTRKWARRHPSFMIWSAVLLVLGFIGLAVSTALIAREQALTQKALDNEKKRALEANQRFKLAKRSADDMIRLAQEELVDNPYMHNFRRQLLEAAVSYYEEFIELQREDPDAQAELAATRNRLKSILEDLAVLQGAGHHFLLKRTPVLDELDLSGDQRVRIADLLKECDKQRPEAFGGFRRLDPAEKEKRFLEMARSTESSMAEILTPNQLRRFRQIAVQAKGPSAFREPDVAVQLKLSNEQKRQMRLIEARLFDEPPEFRPGGPPPWKAHEDKRKSTMKEMISVLTEEQARQWRELVGTPFLAADSLMPPPPPPGGPPFGKGPGGHHGFEPKKKKDF